MATPITTKLHGWAAVHYSEATGAILHLATIERRGEVESERTLTCAEAGAMIQVDQTSARRIHCSASHGERPYEQCTGHALEPAQTQGGK